MGCCYHLFAERESAMAECADRQRRQHAEIDSVPVLSRGSAVDRHRRLRVSWGHFRTATRCGTRYRSSGEVIRPVSIQPCLRPIGQSTDDLNGAECLSPRSAKTRHQSYATLNDMNSLFLSSSLDDRIPGDIFTGLSVPPEHQSAASGKIVPPTSRFSGGGRQNLVPPGIPST